MLLLADSGSTKTDWRLLSKEGETLLSLQTKGLNPYFLSEVEMKNELQNQVKSMVTAEVDQVYFYGAGCGQQKKAAGLAKVLNEVFPSEFQAEVAGDILGAARSLFQFESGIPCILGTGANSCEYDGGQIIRRVPSLGYILGDYGSGTVLCKDLLQMLLQNDEAAELRELFFEEHSLDFASVLDEIYNQPLANRFLASFTPFLLKHADHQGVETIIYRNFREFFKHYIVPYRKAGSVAPLAFTGSIAYHFRDYVNEVAAEFNETVQSIQQSPIDGLVKYHCSSLATH